MKNLLCLLLLCMSTNLIAQYPILGNVSDQNGNYLPGATVLLSETDRGAFSDSDGFFIFSNLPKGTYELEVSYIGYSTWKQTIELTGKVVLDVVLLEESVNMPGVEVLSTWADDKTPMTFTNLDKTEIDKLNLGQDVPFVLKWTPSVIVNSDAGAGIGYTDIRVRGTDPTRINVTINGISLNDAESQGTFWVDLPDFLSSTQEVQIQRGVGTSTNGAGAFGATINLNTAAVKAKPYVSLGGSIGSFNTWKSNVQFGTGMLGGKFTIDGRASYIHSDGYIDRAEANLQSGFLSAAYLGDKQSLRLNVFSGHEVTYQAWNGVPADLIDDEETRTFNSAGTEKEGEPYDNEVDDYTQTHVQLIYNKVLTENLDLDLAAHYTKGRGFFEQYKAGQTLGGYGLSSVSDPANDTIYEVSDLVRRRWLDNDFYGMTYALKYRQEQFNLTFGGAINNYEGKHFGEVIEATHILEDEIGTRYYDNDASKFDFNAFVKVNYAFNEKWNAYFDMQHRYIRYEFLGVDETGENVTQDATLNFFNPKAGLLYQLDAKQQFYVSHAIANREPNRNDYTESTPANRPEHETLYNTELGYRLKKSKAHFGANLYHMYYKNQLVVTGELNDVGGAKRINVPNSYRFGLELDGQVALFKNLSLMGNATLSQNKITSSFTEFLDEYAGENFDWIGQQTIERKDTDIALSPSVIGSLGLNYVILNDPSSKHYLEVGLQGKYIGEQFIDNSGEDDNKIDDYFFADFRLGYNLKPKFAKRLAVTLLVNNVFNSFYESKAWSYRYVYEGDQYLDQGYYPQAGTNFLLGLEIGF